MINIDYNISVMEKKTYYLGVRISENLKKELQELAHKDDRVLADYVRRILKKCVKTTKKKSGVL